jgi:hypothetical protein
MLPRLHILIKGITAVVMIGALLLLVSGNYWAYGFQKDRKAAMKAAANAGEEETGAASSVPNPTEEKTPNGLQNISEYLHDHSCAIHHPVAVINTGYHSGFEQLPVHHPDLVTPPPKRG